ncbi:hypothetical protein BSKO_08437 [Bryopsis sp. KO-2023]|nr:hypothetical protein BSKO_08437 [Bryopsis sp. KO-2023]
MLVSGTHPPPQSGAGRGECASDGLRQTFPARSGRRPAARRVAGDVCRNRCRHEARPAREVACSAGSNGVTPEFVTGDDITFLSRAAEISGGSIGITQPHPNAGCVLVSPNGQVLSSGCQQAQGTTSAEVQAVTLAGGDARGSTAYINLESGDCHGDVAAIKALIMGGVERVVIGLKHPLPHLRGKALQALMAHGISVVSLEGSPSVAEPEAVEGALMDCLKANEPLFHRAMTKRPFSVLKYAMTLDGKIAATTGHSAWVSTSVARQEVFRMRAASDAVIVGGQTVRRDNPRLTTRMDSGHTPARILMSRTLDLPEDANLWNVDIAPTIVMTQRGARRDFQNKLRHKAVEVIEFDFLTPGNVADYCYERGFIQCLWECGGELAAPALAQNVIHKIMAFIAPKIIGGVGAPTPCGDLGFVEMTQAVPIVETSMKPVGNDWMVEGYLPASGGLKKLHENLSATDARTPVSPTTAPTSAQNIPLITHSTLQQAERQSESQIGFYKAWDKWGSLSNFSPHPIVMLEGKAPFGRAASPGESGTREWLSVEHFYQAQKFAETGNEESQAVFDEIAAASSPEEAARIGRSTARSKPHLLCPDWSNRQVEVMKEGIRAKFTAHEAPRKMLLSTSDEEGVLMELSPHDFFWGCGADRTGQNQLGKLLMELREELRSSEASSEESLLMSL